MTTVSEPIFRSRASSLALRYALRELRGGLRGFYVFIACITIRRSFPAASSSASHSPARLHPIPRFSSPMSRPAISMKRPASR